MRQLNRAGYDLIKKFEGLKLHAYLCPAGVWTIGYGRTRGVHPKLQITPERAEHYLQEDLLWACKAVSDAITVKLTDNQFAALVSLTYNIGETAFKGSTLVKKLNASEYDAIPEQIKRWNKAGGVTVMGLINRRKAEAELWAT